MNNVVPISIREHNGARPHQRAQGDPSRVVRTDVENLAGITVEHVRAGVALTPKGALLLRQFRERAS